jgi:hypothetical protein
MAPIVFISWYVAVESGMCGSSSGGDSYWTEKRKKKGRAQESPRVVPSSISTSNNSRAASDPDTSETLQDRQALKSLPQIGLAHHQNRQTLNSSKLSRKQDRCITKLTEKKLKNALHVLMCKYYSSYMVIIYALSSKQGAHGG